MYLQTDRDRKGLWTKTGGLVGLWLIFDVTVDAIFV